ncbi:MAG: hypothetical protein AAGD07_02735 [Planctomycetota bacterium]
MRDDRARSRWRQLRLERLETRLPYDASLDPALAVAASVPVVEAASAAAQSVADSFVQQASVESSGIGVALVDSIDGYLSSPNTVTGIGSSSTGHEWVVPRADGSTWTLRTDDDGFQNSLYGRLTLPDGTPGPAEQLLAILVDQGSSSEPTWINDFHAAPRSNGGFMITWSHNGAIKTQAFDEAGTALAEPSVLHEDASTLATHEVAVLLSDQGQGIVAFLDVTAGMLNLQKIDATGHAIGSWQTLYQFNQSELPWELDLQTHPIADAALGIAVSDTTGTASYLLWALDIDSLASPTFVQIPSFDAQSPPAFGVLIDGAWVVPGRLSEAGQERPTLDVLEPGGGLRYQVIVDESEGLVEGIPSIIGLADGGFAVARFHQGTDADQVVLSRWNRLGQPVALDVVLNEAAIAGPDRVQLIALPNGDYSATWRGLALDGEGDTLVTRHGRWEEVTLSFTTADSPSEGAWIRIEGLPEYAGLDNGLPTPGGAWLIAAADAHTVTMIATEEFVPIKLELSLVDETSQQIGPEGAAVLLGTDGDDVLLLDDEVQEIHGAGGHDVLEFYGPSSNFTASWVEVDAVFSLTDSYSNQTWLVSDVEQVVVDQQLVDVDDWIDVLASDQTAPGENGGDAPNLDSPSGDESLPPPPSLPNAGGSSSGPPPAPTTPGNHGQVNHPPSSHGHGGSAAQHSGAPFSGNSHSSSVGNSGHAAGTSTRETSSRSQSNRSEQSRSEPSRGGKETKSSTKGDVASRRGDDGDRESVERLEANAVVAADQVLEESIDPAAANRSVERLRQREQMRPHAVPTVSSHASAAPLRVRHSVAWPQAALQNSDFLLTQQDMTLPSIEPIFASKTIAARATFDVDALFENVDEVHAEIVEDNEVVELVAGTAVVVATGLSLAQMGWLLRGTALLTKVLTNMPLWVAFDPLPIAMNPLPPKMAGGPKESLLDIATSEHPRQAVI